MQPRRAYTAPELVRITTTHTSIQLAIMRAKPLSTRLSALYEFVINISGEELDLCLDDLSIALHIQPPLSELDTAWSRATLDEILTAIASTRHRELWT